MIGRIRAAGERTGDHRGAADRQCGGEDGEVLEQVRPGVAGGVVGRDAVVAQVDAQLAVAGDGVPQDRVAEMVIRWAPPTVDPVAGC